MKTFIPSGPGQTKCPDTPMVFQKDFFGEKNQHTPKIMKKYYPACKELSYVIVSLVKQMVCLSNIFEAWFQKPLVFISTN